MHATTAEVLAALDRSRDALTQAILRVPASLRETTPAPGRWTVAQVVEHLAIVETRIAGVMQNLIESARAGGLGAETLTGSAFGAADWSSIADRTVRRVASEANTPAADADLTHATWRLAQQRATVRTLLRNADGLALSTVVAPHPMLGEINVYQWALFVATHETRHAAQVSEIADTFARNADATENDAARRLLRHTVATVAYRVGKAVRQPPDKFGKFRASPTSRSAVEIVAHMGDLFDWALSMAKGTGCLAQQRRDEVDARGRTDVRRHDGVRRLPGRRCGAALPHRAAVAGTGGRRARAHRAIDADAAHGRWRGARRELCAG